MLMLVRLVTISLALPGDVGGGTHLVWHLHLHRDTHLAGHLPGLLAGHLPALPLHSPLADRTEVSSKAGLGLCPSLPVDLSADLTAVPGHDVLALLDVSRLHHCVVLLVTLPLDLDDVLGVTVVQLVFVLEVTSVRSSTGGGGEAEKKDCRQHVRGCQGIRSSLLLSQKLKFSEVAPLRSLLIYQLGRSCWYLDLRMSSTAK